MKKTTIIVLAIVYIVSFFLVGLLGQAVRAYDPVVYPEAIVLTEPDGTATVKEDVKVDETVFDYWYVVNPYKEGMVFTLKAEVKPENTSFKDVSFIKDESNTTFNLITHNDDSRVEKNYVAITLNEKPSPVTTARFFVSTQTPGTNIKLRVGVVFVG